MSHCPSVAKDLAQACDGEGSLAIRATQRVCSIQISTSEFVGATLMFCAGTEYKLRSNYS